MCHDGKSCCFVAMFDLSRLRGGGVGKLPGDAGGSDYEMTVRYGRFLAGKDGPFVEAIWSFGLARLLVGIDGNAAPQLVIADRA